MSSPVAPHSWTVLVPVRGGDSGKSRLSRIEGRPLSGSDRILLTLAMAQDTVDAAMAAQVGPVIVVTGDDEVSALARSRGAGVAVDGGRGLNAELSVAGDAVDRSRGVCALLGDLPALTPQALTAALAATVRTPRRAAFVPDDEGAGTALVALAPGAAVRDPFRFGPDSARRHADAGLAPVGLHLASLRCDVDTGDAWTRALGLGLGPATAAARRSILSRAVEPDRTPSCGYAAPMAQGSVHTFDPGTGGGSVLLDDGVEVPFPPEAFAVSGLRLLRPGQRVSLERDPDGGVVRLFIRGIGEGETIR